MQHAEESENTVRDMRRKMEEDANEKEKIKNRIEELHDQLDGHRKKYNVLLSEREGLLRHREKNEREIMKLDQALERLDAELSAKDANILDLLRQIMDLKELYDLAEDRLKKVPRSLSVISVTFAQLTHRPAVRVRRVRA